MLHIIRRTAKPLGSPESSWAYPFCYNFLFAQWKYSLASTALTTIGMKPWFTPQTPLHCPKEVPSLLTNKEVWFNLPGQASIFKPKEGTAQLCKTSAAVTKTLIWVFIGHRNGFIKDIIFFTSILFIQRLYSSSPSIPEIPKMIGIAITVINCPAGELK